ncbi:MAG: bifunctional homocysteine S-methyltransferase/methylenetetrahydrofolate reductase [Candidatus Aminicenantes bacterium]|nr:bifunctional homocysteine S-methyltransferase/methylenetetrahydrofolate reductase [Candidatus Aminicenantes bacterium]
MKIEEWLNLFQERVILADGAMGTMLYNKGIYLNLCFDEVNLTNPDLVRSIHREYIQAGAEIIETNTFGANRFKLKKYGLEDKVREINLAGVAIARQEAGSKVWVAGSIGPLGVKIEPWGSTSIEEAEEAFREQAAALLAGGVDLFILETFSDINEIHQAIKAIQKEAPEVLIIAQMTIEEDGNSLYGTTPEVFTRKLEEWGAHIIGVNCSVGPAAMLQCIERMARVTAKPLSAMPNAGIPRNVEGRNIYLCSPDYLAEYARRFILNGVRLLGGCCGTTPAHIRAIRGAIRSLQPAHRPIIFIKEEVEEAKETMPKPMAEKSALGQKLSEGKFVVSVEIVPPRGCDPTSALEIARQLKDKGVDCVNIPDGPRASARMSSMALAFLIQAQAGLEVILHYTCRDRNLLGIQSDLLGIHAHGIRNLLLITGDPPKLGDYPDATAVFDVDSIGLTKVVNSLNRGLDIGRRRLPQPTSFLIGVGVNPGAINIDYEMSRFHWKVEAGAEFAITQPVFDIQLLENFLRRAEPYKLPIIAGVWPLASLRNAEFMHNEVPGARVPEEIMGRMRRAQEVSPERAREEGIAIAQEIVSQIKNLVQGIQISPPLGRYEAALQVLEAL